MKGLFHGLAIYDTGSQALDWGELCSRDGSAVVQRLTQRIDHSPDQRRPHRDRHDSLGALDDISLAYTRVFPEEHNSDVIFFQVERNSLHAVGKIQKFPGHHLLQSMDPGNSIPDRNHRAYFAHDDPGLVILDLISQYLADLVGPYFHDVPSLLDVVEAPVLRRPA